MAESMIDRNSGRIPEGWISGTETKGSLYFAAGNKRYCAYQIIGRTSIADRCAELLGVERQDIWIQVKNTPYFHPALNCVYILCCRLKHEGRSPSTLSDQALKGWLKPYSNQFPNSRVHEGSPSPIAIEAKAEISSDSDQPTVWTEMHSHMLFEALTPIASARCRMGSIHSLSNGDVMIEFPTNTFARKALERKSEIQSAINKIYSDKARVYLKVGSNINPMTDEEQSLRDPVAVLPPLRTVEEIASPELTFEMLNEMLNRVGQHQPVIDFDLAWPAWGYTRRDEAIRAWKSKGYVEGKDWFPEVCDNFPQVGGKSGEGPGRPKESIYLTIHCFKRFCVQAGTKRASEYLDYLIQAEEELYTLKQSQPDPVTLPVQSDPGLSQFDVMIQLIQEQKEQHLFRRNQEMLNQQTQQHIQRLESQNKQIIETQQKAIQDLSLMPQEQLDTEDPRYWTNLVTQRINDYCAATGLTHHDARKRFNQYAQVQLRINLKTRQNHGFKGTLMDLIRENGLGRPAYAVALKLFPVPGMNADDIP